MKKLFTTLLCFSLLLFVSETPAQAKTLYQEKGSVDVPSDEVIDDDLFAAADTVNIEGTVNGDVYIGAGTVRVSGEIDGNLHIGAGTVTISGPVSGNVYVGAGTVSLEGAKIGGSVLAGTGTLTADAATTIGRSLIAGSGTVNNNAKIGRNLVLGAGTLDLNSAVGGEAQLGVGKINIGPEASIAGNLTYTSDNETGSFTIAKEASVGGQIKKIDTKAMSKFNQAAGRNGLNTLRSTKLGLNIISFAGALIIGLLLIKLLPKASSEVSQQVGKAFFSNIGVGLLVSVLALPALILMAITVVGLPLAGITFALFLITLYLSKLAIGAWAGSYIAEKFGWKRMSFYAAFTLGLTAVYILKNIPIIGFFSSLIIGLTGLGALSIYYKNKLSRR